MWRFRRRVCGVFTFPCTSFSLSLMSSQCRSGCPSTTCVPASCLCHSWSLWRAIVDSPTYDLHRRSSCTRMGALEHESSTVKSIPISCISSTLPWPSATVVSYHTLVISNRGQLFPTESDGELTIRSSQFVSKYRQWSSTTLYPNDFFLPSPM